MESANFKEEARRLLERLADNATWEDLMHEIYVHEAIEAGLNDSRSGRVSSIEAVRNRLGLANQ